METIGPLIVSYAIFGSISPEAALSATIESVKVPYLLLGGLFVLVAVFFWISKLPRITNDEHAGSWIGCVEISTVDIGN